MYIVLGLLVTVYSVSSWKDKKHRQSIRQREKMYPHILIVNDNYLDTTSVQQNNMYV
ncbi:MAG: hypothetical protein NZL83_00425 [Candidatus Absconditabacterales bacterium]|nr:hypothetical protein [Candidatus Absconditabacterales bacterium]